MNGDLEIKKRSVDEMAGRVLYVVRAFDVNRKLVGCGVARSQQIADRLAEKYSRKGAFWIDIEVVKHD